MQITYYWGLPLFRPPSTFVLGIMWCKTKYLLILPGLFLSLAAGAQRRPANDAGITFEVTDSLKNPLQYATVALKAVPGKAALRRHDRRGRQMRLRAPRRKLRGHGLLHRIRHAAHDARRPVRKRDLPGRKAPGRIDGNPRRGHHGHRSPGTRLGRAHRPRGDAAPPAVELRGPARTAPRRKGVGSGLLGIEPHPPARSGHLRRRLRHLVAGSWTGGRSRTTQRCSTEAPCRAA